MSIDIQHVEGSGQIDKFIRFAWDVYRGNPLWVPPVLRDVKKFLEGRGAFFKHCEHRLFAATENGKVVARVAAFYDRNLTEQWKRPIGLLGFFEALPEKEAAVKSLFEAAELYLRQKGAEVAWGPMNGGISNPCGLLANAYNQMPVFLMMYNPSYYHQYFRRMGYYPIKELIAFSMDLMDGRLTRKIGFVLKSAKKSVVKIRTFNPKDFRHEVDRLASVYGRTFESHWGFAPQSHEELYEMLEPVKVALDYDFILFAEHEDRLIGFALAVPDYNSVVKKMNGNVNFFSALAFLRMKRSIREGRIIGVGVIPEWRGQNVAPLLAASVYHAMIKKGYIKCEYSWVFGENIASQNVARKFDDDAYKHYFVYERDLTKDSAKRFLK